MVRKRKLAGDVVRETMVYFGIKAPDERIPQVLWADRKYAAHALASAKAPRGLRIVRTYVTVELVQGTTRRPARSVS